MATNRSFESSLKQLEDCVDQLESGDLTLDQALKVFTSGVKKAEGCRKMLRDVELKIATLQQQDDGSLREETFNDA